MKRITYSAIIFFIAISFVSCRKDRTCDCTYTVTEGSSTLTFTTSYTMGYSTKKEAKRGKGEDPFLGLPNDCFSTKQVETDNGVQTITTKTCKLK